MPSNTHLGLKLRSGNALMSDAPDWNAIPAMTAPGPLVLASNRYVQFQANLRPPTLFGESTPQLRDVTISWTGPTQPVAISGSFATGPDYGIWELKVDNPSTSPTRAPMLIVH